MRDAGAVDDAGQIELDMPGAEVLEEPPALAQEDRDEVDLQLVEHSGAQAQLREIGPVWTSTSASPAACLAWRIALFTPSVT